MHNMKKTKLLIITLLLIDLYSCNQELTCDDFKTGQFYIPETKEMSKFSVTENDSITEYMDKRDSSIKKYIVIRKKNTQIEWKNGIGKGKPLYVVIEWIDKCTYRLTYDSSKSELDEEKKWVNANNGIVVSKRKIKNKCLYYTATMTTKEGKKIAKNGIICKE